MFKIALHDTTAVHGSYHGTSGTVQNCEFQPESTIFKLEIDDVVTGKSAWVSG